MCVTLCLDVVKWPILSKAAVCHSEVLLRFGGMDLTGLMLLSNMHALPFM